jgi:hypothetical protein
VVRNAFAEKPDRTWAAKEVGLIVPRQQGKGTILEAVELAYLFLFDARLIFHSAHEFRTAKEAYRRIRGLVESTPHLRTQVKQWRQSNEDVSLELKNGAYLRFVARSSGATRGLTADAVIFDESFNLSRDALAAMLPTTMTNPNAQFWYTSSAGMESSHVLAGIRERGRTGDPRLAYFEWSAPDDADLDDPEAWAQANPGLGIRVHADAIATMRAALDDDAFARENLGIWYDPNAQSVIDADLWTAAADPASVATDPVAFAVDVAPDRRTASIGVAAYRADGLLHLEVPESRAGTGWVAERLAQMVARANPCAVVLDGTGPAGSLLPELDRAGIEVTSANARQMSQGCGLLYDAVTDKRLRHVNGTALNAALGSARKRVLGDSWVWQRKDTGTDITPLVACTLALWGLLATLPAPSVYEDRGMVTV